MPVPPGSGHRWTARREAYQCWSIKEDRAKEVGRDPSTVSRWCTNDMQPPVEVLFQVAELLEVDVCDLLVRDQRNDATP
ncbi:MAG: helix-turn-helix transcriptional regulator [Lewinellaceae bacterium]|nr:helix-turn-helix transcriptional regulator [Lewinellaceae bacterium]